MTRRLFIHTGAQKTATSSQQVWFYKNSAWLRDHGIAYPSDLIGPHGNCLIFAHALTRPPEVRKPKDWQALVDLGGFLKDNLQSDCLLSAEDFNKPPSVDAAAQMASLLADTNRQITTLTFVRPQADFMSSLYAQRMKALYPLDPFSVALTIPDLLDHCDWLQRDQIYEAVGFERRFAVFRGSKADPVHEILALLDVKNLTERPDPDGPDHYNPSLGSIAVPVCRHIGVHLAKAHRVATTPLSYRISRSVATYAKQSRERRFVGPDVQEVSAIAARYSDSNREFLRRNPHLPGDLLLHSALEGHARTPSDVAELTGEDREKAAHVLETIRAEFADDPDIAAAGLAGALKTLPRI